MVLNLNSGNCLIDILPDDREKIAFWIGQGLWQLTVLHFDLCSDLRKVFRHYREALV